MWICWIAKNTNTCELWDNHRHRMVNLLDHRPMIRQCFDHTPTSPGKTTYSIHEKRLVSIIVMRYQMIHWQLARKKILFLMWDNIFSTRRHSDGCMYMCRIVSVCMCVCVRVSVFYAILHIRHVWHLKFAQFGSSLRRIAHKYKQN